MEGQTLPLEETRWCLNCKHEVTFEINEVCSKCLMSTLGAINQEDRKPFWEKKDFYEN